MDGWGAVTGLFGLVLLQYRGRQNTDGKLLGFFFSFFSRAAVDVKLRQTQQQRTLKGN